MIKFPLLGICIVVVMYGVTLTTGAILVDGEELIEPSGLDDRFTTILSNQLPPPFSSVIQEPPAYLYNGLIHKKRIKCYKAIFEMKYLKKKIL